MRFLIIIALALLIASGAQAQGASYSQDGAVIAGGSTEVTAGSYTLTAQLAQPGQSPAGGGDYRVGDGPPLSALTTGQLYLPLTTR